MLVLLFVALVPVAKAEKEMAAFVSCPNGPVTLQGCEEDVNGCFVLNTINGRIIDIGIYDYPVGDGDEISITGNWQTDADCAKCYQCNRPWRLPLISCDIED